MKYRRWRLNKFVYFILLIFFSLAAAPIASAKEPSGVFNLGELNFHTVSDNDDAPGGIITSLAQDASGFVWVGSFSGLYRYDGYAFKSYQHVPNGAESSSHIHALWAADNGQVWIATQSDGVSVYDPKTDSFSLFPYIKDTPNTVSGSAVRAIVGDNKGHVFVGTNAGVDIIFPSGSVQHLPTVEGCEVSLGDTRIRSLLVSKDGWLWIGSRSGLCKFDLSQLPSGEQFTSPLEGTEIKEFNEQSIFQLFQASDDSMWIGTTEHGAAWLKANSDVVQRIPFNTSDFNSLGHRWVVGLAQPFANEIWIGTNGGGITAVDLHTGQVLSQIRHDLANTNSINSNIIGSLLVDDSGLLWVGTWGAGLNMLRRKDAAVRMLIQSPYNDLSLSHANVWSILERQNGDVWVGNSQAGIDIIKADSRTIERFDSHLTGLLPEDGSITSLREATDGAIWIGTDSEGLRRYDPQTNSLHHFSVNNGLPNYQIRTLYEAPNNKLWVGTSSGIAKIDLATLQLDSLAHIENLDLLKQKGIRKFLRNGDYLWIATNSGLFVLSMQTHRLIEVALNLSNGEVLNNNEINGLMFDIDGSMLLASGQGVSRLLSFDGNKAVFQSINADVGKPLTISTNIMQDKSGRIWSSRDWLDPVRGKYHILGKKEGWDIGTSWVNSFAELRDGTLVWGGTKGLLMLQPDLWQEWEYQPSLVVSQLRIDNQSVNPNQAILLTEQNNSISIQFAALDYSSPDDINYAYKLVGYNDDWIASDASDRRATYTGLPVGKYQLKVKGTNRLGEWSPQELSLNITRLPAWYETKWFMLSQVLVLIASVFYLIQWRTGYLNRKKKLLNQLVKKRTAELRDKNKELKNALAKLEMTSITDQLTGVRNRHFFEQVIYEEMKRFEIDPDKQPTVDDPCMGFVFVDVDFFKKVNDNYGHNAGDQVLIQLTQILTKLSRKDDWVIRWGGEEFLIVCRDTSFAKLEIITERLRTAVEEHSFILDEYQSIQVTCSIGFCCFPFNKADPAMLTLNETLNFADIALYKAKTTGRNAWVGISYNEHLANNYIKEVLVNDHQQAIDDGMLQLVSSNKNVSRSQHRAHH